MACGCLVHQANQTSRHPAAVACICCTAQLIICTIKRTCADLQGQGGLAAGRHRPPDRLRCALTGGSCLLGQAWCWPARRVNLECWGCQVSPACSHPAWWRRLLGAGIGARKDAGAQHAVHAGAAWSAVWLLSVMRAATASEAGWCPMRMAIPHAAGSGGHSCGRTLQDQPPGDQPPHRGTLLRGGAAHELRRVGRIRCGKGVCL